MSLTSIYFLLFSLLGAIAYRFIAVKYKSWLILLLNTLFLLQFSLIHLIVFVAVVGISYVSSVFIAHSKKPFICLYSTIVLLLGLLFSLKSTDVRLGLSIYVGIIGLSYYTLQAIAYLTELSLDNRFKKVSFIELVLYLGFFPKLLQGPIEHPTKFLMQLRVAQNPTEKQVTTGIQRLLWGLFKKLVIANHLQTMAMGMLDANNPIDGWVLGLGYLLYSLYLFIDFSAYCDIAIGISGLYGISLTENFKQPFSATSITDFWRRWHITLIAWLRQYIYEPIVFKYRSYGIIAIAGGILLTFLLSGVWHGLALTFLCWALLHGTMVSIELLFHRLPWVSRIKIPKFALQIWVFVFFSIGNIFFTASDMHEAIQHVQNIATVSHWEFNHALYQLAIPVAGGGEPWQLANCTIYLILGILTVRYELFILQKTATEKLNVPLLFILTLLIILFAKFDGASEFIYQVF
jgi:D-alanyl-lipoteichoic acid acyltransferase DltB (MBOAT superfamily)